MASLAAATSSFAVVASPDASTPTPIDTTFLYVGQVGTASGVAVGPHKVLASAHVGGADFTLDGTTYHATDYQYASAFGYDLDLLVIDVAETLPGFYGIADSIADGSTISMAGFGPSGVVNDAGDGYDMNIGSGSRHSGANAIDFRQAFEGTGQALVSYLDGPGEAALGVGDSGGGWFAGGRLVGISTFNFNETSPAQGFAAKYRDFGFPAMNVAGYDSTIDSPGYTGEPYSIPARTRYFGSGAVDLTSDDARAFLRATGVVPEPAPLAALGLAALAFVRRRRA